MVASESDREEEIIELYDETPSSEKPSKDEELTTIQKVLLFIFLSMMTLFPGIAIFLSCWAGLFSGDLLLIFLQIYLMGLGAYFLSFWFPMFFVALGRMDLERCEEIIFHLLHGFLIYLGLGPVLVGSSIFIIWVFPGGLFFGLFLIGIGGSVMKIGLDSYNREKEGFIIKFG